jgi:hypothetical protein
VVHSCTHHDPMRSSQILQTICWVRTFLRLPAPFLFSVIPTEPTSSCARRPNILSTEYGNCIGTFGS